MFPKKSKIRTQKSVHRTFNGGIYNPEVKVSEKFQVLGTKWQVLRKVFITPNFPSPFFRIDTTSNPFFKL